MFLWKNPQPHRKWAVYLEWWRKKEENVRPHFQIIIFGDKLSCVETLKLFRFILNAVILHRGKVNGADVFSWIEKLSVFLQNFFSKQNETSLLGAVECLDRPAAGGEETSIRSSRKDGLSSGSEKESNNMCFKNVSWRLTSLYFSSCTSVKLIKKKMFRKFRFIISSPPCWWELGEVCRPQNISGASQQK